MLASSVRSWNSGQEFLQTVQVIYIFSIKFEQITEGVNKGYDILKLCLHNPRCKTVFDNLVNSTKSVQTSLNPKIHVV
jgi:hypothetical protein